MRPRWETVDIDSAAELRTETDGKNTHEYMLDNTHRFRWGSTCARYETFSDVPGLDTNAEYSSTRKQTFSDVCSINNLMYQY